MNACFDSIVNQTYSNLEIILVDDGSPDKCPEICDEYARIDPRVKVFHKSNGGLSDARNAGIEVCNGEYAAFIDGDDYVSNDYIETLYSAIQSSKADISVVDYQRFKKSESIKLKTDWSVCESLDSRKAIEHFCSIKEPNPFLSSCAKLYNVAFFRNYRFPVGRLYEDVYINFEILYKANGIVYIHKPLYFYRIRENSISTRTFDEKYLDFIAAYKHGMSYFEKIGMPELAALFIPRILMSEIYAYWSVKYILKDRKLSKTILYDYKKDLRYPSGLQSMGFSWKIAFRLLGKFPFLYACYKILFVTKNDVF